MAVTLKECLEIEQVALERMLDFAEGSYGTTRSVPLAWLVGYVGKG